MKNIAEIKTRIGYEEYYFLIVPDVAAGKKYRYTMYRVPSSPSRRIKLVARECTLAHCRLIARNYPTTKKMSVAKTDDDFRSFLKEWEAGIIRPRIPRLRHP